MSRKLKTEAIVLKKKALANKDNLITLFSKELGKIRILAKGVKTITSKRLPHIQTANLIYVVLHRSNDMFFLQETNLISAFSRIKKDPEKMGFLYFTLFVLDRLLPESEKEMEIYELTKKFLIRLSELGDYGFPHLEKDLNLLLKKLGYIQEEKTLGELKLLIEELINEKVPFFII